MRPSKPAPSLRPPFKTLALLGFTAGIPLSLTTGTLQAWLEQCHVPLGAIGLFALAGLPYSLKFLWSPLLDHLPLPLGGRRRGWIALGFLGLTAVLLLLGPADPRHQLAWVGGLAFLTAFAGASADIALDAYRTEVLPLERQGQGSSIHITAYRCGMVLAGAGALWLSGRLAWRWVFLLLGLVMVPGALAALRAPEPEGLERPQSLRHAVVEPFREFLGRRSALAMGASILLFKTGDNLATLLLNPFLLERGYPAPEIGLASGYAGLAALFAGGLAGGWLLHRHPLGPCLRALAWAQSLAVLATLALVPLAPSRGLLFGLVALQNFTFALGSVAFLTLIATLCHPRHAATQFALLTGLSALTRVLFPSVAGFLAQGLGWPAFLLLSALLGLPVLLPLRNLEAWDWPSSGVS